MKKEVETTKKKYVAPTITNYGSVEQLTQRGGGNSTDVPIGTPNPPPNPVNNIVS